MSLTPSYQIVIGVAAVLIAYVVMKRRNAAARRPGEPPIVGGAAPFVGHGAKFASDSVALLNECRAKHGDVFTLSMAGQRMTFFCSPRAFETIYRNRQLRFREISFKIGAVSVGNYFLYRKTKDGSWSGNHDDLGNEKNDRILFDEIHDRYFTYLKGRSLDEMVESSSQHSYNMIAGTGETAVTSEWRDVDLVDWTRRVVFGLTAEMLFGKGFYAPRLVDAFKKWDDQFAVIVAGIPAWLVGAEKPRAQLVARFAEFLPLSSEASALAQERHRLLIEEHKANVEDYGRQEIGLLWAAMANTAPAAFWALHLILHNPKAHQAVCDELARVVSADSLNNSDSEHGPSLTRALLDQLPILESAILESLRLSAASMSIRVVQDDSTVVLPSGEQVALRKGDHVALYPPLTHNDERVFENPQKFVFDRFLDENGLPKKTFTFEGAPLPNALVPFGGGVSKCPGRRLAIAEIKEVVVWTLLLCDVEVVGASSVTFNKSRAGLGIMPPVGSSPVRMRRKATV